MFGDIAALPQTLLFCGTHDILVADARRFAALADAAGISLEYHEEEGLIHAYPLLFFPESRKARDRIMHFLNAAIGAAPPGLPAGARDRWEKPAAEGNACASS
jgi:monoterpene epsilon-lactone hydrolase